jgi:imidazoleglycerol phosphate dehydratase HisB
MTATEREGEAQSLVRVTVDGHGTATVGTGLPVLDHLLGLLAVHGLDIQLVALAQVVLESRRGRAPAVRRRVARAAAGTAPP